jgi:soluble lytic murein transglycosylase-like protein
MRDTAGLAALALLVILALGSLRLADEPVALPPAVAPEPRLTPQSYDLPLEYAQTVIAAADETGVPVWLLCRLISWESGWRPGYISRMNANGTYDLGIAALNTGSLRYLSARFNGAQPIDPHDAELDIAIAARYLADLQARTGSWREAVRLYAGNRPESHTRSIMGEGR